MWWHVVLTPYTGATGFDLGRELGCSRAVALVFLGHLIKLRSVFAFIDLVAGNTIVGLHEFYKRIAFSINRLRRKYSNGEHLQADKTHRRRRARKKSG